VGNVVATDVMEVVIGVVLVVAGVAEVGALLLFAEELEKVEVVVGGDDVVGAIVVGTAVTDVG
jgi:uncharacterized membrane protein HdeD (DUF308 family)